MDIDEDRPLKSARQIVLGQPLDDFSVDELQQLIAALKSEITRVEADIVNKHSTKSAADSVFNI
jgi:uncharacterized small protein (DUF1192 family)